MITGEAAQDMVPNEASTRGSSSTSTNNSDSRGPATPAAQAQPSGLLGVAAAAASTGTRRLGAMTGLKLPEGWQLQKWPTEASGCGLLLCERTACGGFLHQRASVVVVKQKTRQRSVQHSQQRGRCNTAVQGVFTERLLRPSTSWIGGVDITQHDCRVLPRDWCCCWSVPAVEPWAGWFVVAAFAAILMWEQVWDLPGHAALSGGCKQLQ